METAVDPFSPEGPFRLGHAQDLAGGTGCTVVLAPEGAVGAVDVRGGGPATRETDALEPHNLVERIHGVVLAGGSAFGLEAATGVMEVLAEQGKGFFLAGQHVPIVTGACLFDLPVGSPIRPDKAMGRAAAERALAGADGMGAMGNVGAGTGATVGKLGNPAEAMKAGLGTAAETLGELYAVAVTAVNAAGHVREGVRWIAGTRDGDRIMAPQEALSRALGSAQTTNRADGSAESAQAGPVANTTISVVVTNADLTKAQAKRVAIMAHDGYARALEPVHTSNDGDAIFVMAAGTVAASADIVGYMAARAVERAVIAGTKAAEGAYGLPSARDLNPAL